MKHDEKETEIWVDPKTGIWYQVEKP